MPAGHGLLQALRVPWVVFTSQDLAHHLANLFQEPAATKPSSVASPTPTPDSSHNQPASFANGRYQVKRFLGEGGKKKVHLASDTQLHHDCGDKAEYSIAG